MYNAEHYLERCVESCLEQGLQSEEQEILLCNDGSTDGSLELARSLAAQDNRIKVFSQENAGAGIARNLGLRHATGRYVMFVDSDDYLIPHSILGVLELCEQNELDLCKYAIKTIWLNNGNVQLNPLPLAKAKLFTGDEILGKPTIPLDSACSAIYRRLFLLNHALYFNSQTSSEDVVFNLMVFSCAKRIMYSDANVYTYEIRTGSRRHSTDLASRLRYFKNNMTNAAYVKKTANSLNQLSDKTKQSLKRRSNSMAVSDLIELWNSRNFIPRYSASEILELARDLDIYPIKGRTLSWETTLIGHSLLNYKSLFLYFFK